MTPARPDPVRRTFGERARRLLRWLIVPYLVALAIGAMMAIALVGYGLAHGSAESAAKFFAFVAAALAVLGVPPLIVFRRPRDTRLGLDLVAAALVMLVGFGLVAALWWELSGEGRWIAWRFERAMKGIRIEAATHRPLLLQGQQIGLELVVDVRLPRALPMDSIAAALLVALPSAGITGQGPHGGGPMVYGVARGEVHFGERPLEALLGVKLPALLYDVEQWVRAGGKGVAELPAGSYRVVRPLWFKGLRPATDRDPSPCVLLGPKWSPHDVTAAEASSGLPLTAQIHVVMPLGGRRGQRVVQLKAPLPPGYRHDEWLTRLATLPLPNCEAIDAERRKEEQEREAYREVQERKRPVQSLSIYREACAGDLAAVRRRIDHESEPGRPWRPQMWVATLVQDCAVERRQPALMTLLAPHSRDQDFGMHGYTTGWCEVLAKLHRARDAEMLEAARAGGVELDCPDQALWRWGLVAQSADALPVREVASPLPWLALLQRSGVDLCRPPSIRPPGPGPIPKITPPWTIRDSALDVLARHHAPEAIAAVVDAGCSVAAPAEPFDDAHRKAFGLRRVSPALWWLLRRQGSAGTTPLPAADAAMLVRLDRALMPSADELNRIDPATGGTLLHELAERIVTGERPQLLRALADAGARLDAADVLGQSWLDFAPAAMFEHTDRLLALLRELTPAQQRQLARPIVLATGGPGQPVSALKPQLWGRANPLHQRLCEHRSVLCQVR